MLCEGGAATSKFGTSRADAKDIRLAVKFVADTLDLPVKDIEDNLLGSTRMTLAGKKKDSGDIDIAMPIDKQDEYTQKMMKATNGNGKWMPGLSVASFAIPTVADKTVQVDLMFVDSVEWARVGYGSEEGGESKYKGAVKTRIIIAILQHKFVPGEDFKLIVDGQVIARASRSYFQGKGVARLFKAVNKKKDGSFTKNLATVTPDELEKRLKDWGYSDIKFSKSVDLVNNPAKVAKLLFDNGTVDDLKTAERLIAKINQIKDKKLAATIKKQAIENLTKDGLEVPEELK